MEKVKKYSSITKQITFPKVLMERVDAKASSLGYSIPAYVRYVLTKELEKESSPVLDGIVMDEAMVSSIKKGIKEHREGKSVELGSEQDIREDLRRILNEES
ncbi:MAG: hypothetical protein RBS01_01830 [Candidatus Dojkabacteria bacterium]|jgi:ABC-type oligopeptide transport system ATPase subunit|nr:hypothetical protein [Candidatus Dojkabacteria bacterium]